MGLSPSTAVSNELVRCFFLLMGSTHWTSSLKTAPSEGEAVALRQRPEQLLAHSGAARHTAARTVEADAVLVVHLLEVVLRGELDGLNAGAAHAARDVGHQMSVDCRALQHTCGGSKRGRMSGVRVASAGTSPRARARAHLLDDGHLPDDLAHDRSCRSSHGHRCAGGCRLAGRHRCRARPGSCELATRRVPKPAVPHPALVAVHARLDDGSSRHGSCVGQR